MYIQYTYIYINFIISINQTIMLYTLTVLYVNYFSIEHLKFNYLSKKQIIFDKVDLSFVIDIVNPVSGDSGNQVWRWW